MATARTKARRASGVAVALAVTTVLTSPIPRAAAGARRPDIIVIVTDDQHRGTLGWLPTVRRDIAERGVRFTRAMVPTSLCCPSRASILTGQYAHTTKVWSNTSGWRRFADAGMESRTIAVWLRSAGYRTGLVGKYLNGYAGTGPPQGWRVWHAFLGTNGAYYDYSLLHTDGSVTRHGSGPAAYSTDVLRTHAVRFLRTAPERRPLFLYFAPYAPHGPADAAPRHASLPASIPRFHPPSFSEADVSDKPAWVQRLAAVDATSLHTQRQREYRSLRSVDDAVDAILDAQRARGRLGNTLLIFLSDNGQMWGEHRILGKFVPYAGATRIPMAIAWPRRIAAGRVDTRLALNLDVAATVLDAAEAPHERIAGRSLLDRWRRGGSVLEAASAVVPGGNGTNVERPAYCGWRTARFLFVHYASGREELYDYAADPWELSDAHLQDRYRDRRRALRRRTRAACSPVPPGFSWA
jgi:arylsulfatase A-like enzyme